MTPEERNRLAQYRELAPLNAAHGVFLVQREGSDRLFVRKMLTNYQKNIFDSLIASPVPNMPRIVEAVEDDGCLIVIESYLAGRTLQHILEENGPLQTAVVREIGLQLCDILARLHARGIVHRDIKPSNIILSDDGIVKLLDLDAAKVYKAYERQDTQLIGTRGYAAPEQYGFGSSSPATDIYALGILLNVLATGEFPSVAISPHPGLSAIIERCTRLEPSDRYLSVEDLRSALKACGAAESSYTAKPSYTPAPAYAPAPFASGAALAAERTGWRRLIPPGFRTGTVWKVLLALFWYFDTLVLVYLMLFQSSVSGESGVSEGSPAAFWVRLLVGGWVLTVGLGLPFFLCNHLGLWQKLHIDRIRSVFLRYLAAFAWYMGIVLLYLLIIKLIAILRQSS